MQELHPTQAKLLVLLERHRHEQLSIRDLQEELGVSSPSVVLHHIRQLEEKGRLRRNPSNPRDYQVVSGTGDAKVAYLNLYGFAKCGPNGSVLDGDPIEQVPISTKILGFPAGGAFLVRASGDSMTPKIHNKDLVLVKKSDDAQHGEIVVCVNRGEALIKRIQKSDNAIILISENKKYDPFVADKDFRIEGVVRGVISYSF